MTHFDLSVNSVHIASFVSLSGDVCLSLFDLCIFLSVVQLSVGDVWVEFSLTFHLLLLVSVDAIDEGGSDAEVDHDVEDEDDHEGNTDDDEDDDNDEDDDDDEEDDDDDDVSV